MLSVDSFNTLDQFSNNGKQYNFFNLSKLEDNFPKIKNLPKSKKILIENLLRLEDGKDVNKDLIENVLENPEKKHEIFFLPSRVLMQDFTGVPAVADLAAMRDAVSKNGGDPSKVNPMSQVDLVIDHSVMAVSYTHLRAHETN